ncbi:Uncharacterized protein Rs2_12020 [Raphanus sativus]|nr:Uncharacterized protein Rs2_12020 [Raphanus sativus]
MATLLRPVTLPLPLPHSPPPPPRWPPAPPCSPPSPALPPPSDDRPMLVPWTNERNRRPFLPETLSFQPSNKFPALSLSRKKPAKKETRFEIDPITLLVRRAPAPVPRSPSVKTEIRYRTYPSGERRPLYPNRAESFYHVNPNRAESFYHVNPIVVFLLVTGFVLYVLP